MVVSICFERGVVRALIVSPIHQPVVRFGFRVEQALVGDPAGQRRRRGGLARIAPLQRAKVRDEVRDLGRRRIEPRSRSGAARSFSTATEASVSLVEQVQLSGRVDHLQRKRVFVAADAANLPSVPRLRRARLPAPRRDRARRGRRLRTPMGCSDRRSSAAAARAGAGRHSTGLGRRSPPRPLTSWQVAHPARPKNSVSPAAASPPSGAGAPAAGSSLAGCGCRRRAARFRCRSTRRTAASACRARRLRIARERSASVLPCTNVAVASDGPRSLPWPAGPVARLAGLAEQPLALSHRGGAGRQGVSGGAGRVLPGHTARRRSRSPAPAHESGLSRHLGSLRLTPIINP